MWETLRDEFRMMDRDLFEILHAQRFRFIQTERR